MIPTVDVALHSYMEARAITMTMGKDFGGEAIAVLRMPGQDPIEWSSEGDVDAVATILYTANQYSMHSSDLWSLLCVGVG